MEAIVVLRRHGTSRCFIVPIDAAYKLVGIIRTTWKGFDGGEEAWSRIDAFFDDVHERSEGREPARGRW